MDVVYDLSPQSEIKEEGFFFKTVLHFLVAIISCLYPMCSARIVVNDLQKFREKINIRHVPV